MMSAGGNFFFPLLMQINEIIATITMKRTMASATTTSVAWESSG
jgi:hypothetical protein